MRLIIAGSRTITDPAHLHAALLSLPSEIQRNMPPTSVVCGEAPGVDQLGKQWAVRNGVAVHSCPADWANLGNAAGAIRNEFMAQRADALVALWDGWSTGTPDMIARARAHGLPVYVHNVELYGPAAVQSQPAVHGLGPLRGEQFDAGPNVATVLPDFDFETYSEAGLHWDEERQKWRTPDGAPATKRGLSLVGVASYAEHPSTVPLMLAWDLKDHRGPRQWHYGEPPPLELFEHLRAGGLLEAWNVGFEFEIWERCCVPKLGWPSLAPYVEQLRCAMAKGRAFALPGGLDAAAAKALQLPPNLLKDAGGDRLIKKFSVPRNPTKGNPALRLLPADDPVDGAKFAEYNRQDIVAEEAVSVRTPDLPPSELRFWQLDQQINRRGVAVDVDTARACAQIVTAARQRYNAELSHITGGAVPEATKVAEFIKWLSLYGVFTASLDEEAVGGLLARNDLHDGIRRALEIRQGIASAAVGKLFAMLHQVTREGRLHHLFGYHAARTGRANGQGPQPQNLPNSGPDVYGCGCGAMYCARVTCPVCGAVRGPNVKAAEWDYKAVEYFLPILASGSLDTAERFLGRQLFPAIAGCLRGLFIAGPGKELIASDYSAIEAVVLAALAGEEWRLDVFRTHGKIYETSASKITGVSFSDYMQHYGYCPDQLERPEWWLEKPRNPGSHHPHRKKIGKIAELASGYKGWLGAWQAFGAGDYFDDKEIKRHILAWRDASPAIVEFWGGQFRGLPWDSDRREELFGVEGCAVSAILNPGKAYSHRGIAYQTKGDALYCQLLSGRILTYHRPRLVRQFDGQGRDAGYQISFEGWNTNPKQGPIGWVRMTTHGGKLTENIDQATAADILRMGMHHVTDDNYPIVLHVHDEIVAEVPLGWGSVERFESLMMGPLPGWCEGWPVRAAGGWRGLRYRK